MSRWIDLFIDAPMEVAELADELTRVAGLKFTCGPDGARHTAHHGAVVLYLEEHRFLDDRHLPLSKYRYDIAARVSSGSVLDSAEAQVLRHVQGLVRAHGRPALLVFDLQHVIEEADHRLDQNPAEVGQ